MSSRDSDCLHRFVFEHTDVRGEPVQKLLGEAVAAAALLSATIKIDGSLSLQIQGDGPISLVLVEVTAQRTLRGLAHWCGEVPGTGLQAQIGQARLQLIIDPGQGGDRYQGLVAIEQESLQSAVEHYFEQSEQLAPRLWLTADNRRACGMLLQQLPGRGEDNEDWNRDVILGETVSDDELLELSVTELLRRLYHEENVRLFEAEPFSFRCSCSAGRIESMLRGLGYDEVRDILENQGKVSVNCEFCSQVYVYDAVDIERLFAASDQPEVPQTRH